MPLETPTTEEPITPPQTEENLSDKAVPQEDIEDTEEALPDDEAGEEEEEDATGENELTEEELDSVQPGKAKAMDPDFMLILFFAAFLDLAVDPIIETIGLPTIVLPVLGRMLDIGAIVVIGGWIYWKSKKFAMPEKVAERMQKMNPQAIKKIRDKISKKIASKALKKSLVRALPALGVEMVPGASLFTSWVAAVISVLF